MFYKLCADLNASTPYRILSILIVFLLVGCAKNPLLDYLENAEIQYSEVDQRENLIVALNDALTLSTEELAARRYQDYGGNKEQWDLRTLFERHLVPEGQGKTLGSDFYVGIKAQAVQEKIHQILKKLLRDQQGQ